MPDLEAPTDLLHACAGRAQLLGAGVSPIADQFTVTDDAVGWHAGFGSAQALAACQLAWSQRIRQDATALVETGSRLGATADSYVRTDVEAERRMDYELPL